MVLYAVDDLTRTSLGFEAFRKRWVAGPTSPVAVKTEVCNLRKG